MNKVVLVGRLARDPEVRYTQGGKAVASFTIAVNRRVKKDSDRPTADFIPCVAWEGLAEVLSKYCRKGKQVGVEGRIQVRSYDAQDGSKRYATEVIVNELELLGKREDSAPTGQQGAAFTPGGFGRPADDDDIPF